MKKNFLLTALTLLLAAGPGAQAAPAGPVAQGKPVSAQAPHGPLTLDDIVAGKYSAKGARPMVFLSDGTGYASLSDDGKLLLRYDCRSGRLTDTLFNAGTALGVKMKKVEGFCFNAPGTKILLYENSRYIYRRSFTADYYVYDVLHNRLEPLSDQGAQRDASFSPDGRMVAFARGNNLFIKKLDFKTEVAVTADGEPNRIINGTSDWLYEEEFAVTRMYEWTPDSRFLCFVRFDESRVPEYSFPLYACSMSGYEAYRRYPGQYRYKYPAAGQPNSKVSLWAYNVTYRTRQQMSLPIDSTDYIPRIIRTCQSDRMAVVTINRDQNRMEMFTVNPKANTCRTLLTETDECYVDPGDFPAIRFTSKDFTFVSGRDGHRHLYLYGLNGIQKAQVTSGDDELIEYYGRDTVSNTFYYQAVDGKPYRRAVFRTDLKGRTARLCPGEGTHSAVFNDAFTFFTDRFSSTSQPDVVTLYQRDGKALRTLQDNAPLRDLLAETPHAVKEWFETPAADGTVLYGWMVKPAGFDASKQYPLLLVQYSGPDNSLAIDRYKFDWEYFLAQEGYIVACVDGRGTGGRGEAFRKQTYLHLGETETADQCETARALGTLPYVDASRIGIWGWSYGGFISLMCMTEPTPLFKAGIAVAPVTDFRDYNSAYTERFMRRPEENPDGYDATDIIRRAGNLQGSLLLIHGLADDNVRVNQTMELTDALVRAGKQFDMQFYPNRNHSILGLPYRSHLYHRWWNFLQEKL